MQLIAPEHASESSRAVLFDRRLAVAVLAFVGALLLLAACGDSDGDSETSVTTVPVTASSTTSLVPGEAVSFEPFDPFSAELKLALEDGEVDIAVLFSTDGDIAENDWVLLEDDRGLQDKENVVPLIRSDANSPEIESALAAVSERLTTEELTELNRRAVQATPRDVVTGWLEDQDLLPYEGDGVDADLIVGSTDFTESLLIAEMYAQVLEDAGADIDRAMRFGSREEVLPSLEAGDLDLVPELLSSVLRHYEPDVIPPLAVDDVLADARAALPDELELLDPAPAQDTAAFVVAADTAARLGLVQVSDLAQLSEPLVLGGPTDCPFTVSCIAGLEEVYQVPVDLE